MAINKKRMGRILFLQRPQMYRAIFRHLCTSLITIEIFHDQLSILSAFHNNALRFYDFQTSQQIECNCNSSGKVHKPYITFTHAFPRIIITFKFRDYHQKQFPRTVENKKIDTQRYPSLPTFCSQELSSSRLDQLTGLLEIDRLCSARATSVSSLDH